MRLRAAAIVAYLLVSSVLAQDSPPADPVQPSPAAAPRSEADSDRKQRDPLREALSKNRRFELRIKPGRPERAPCRATLFEKTRGSGRKTVWEAELVNDVAPGVVQIRDDGKFVVTLDEHRVGGARHAAAIYNEHGKLLREFKLRDLLRRSDWDEVRRERRSIVWLERARFAFERDPDQFVIRTAWDREIAINLGTAELIRDSSDENAAAENGDESIPPELMELLDEALAGRAPGGRDELERMMQHRATLEAAVAQLEQSGQEVDPALLAALAEASAEIGELEAQMADEPAADGAEQLADAAADGEDMPPAEGEGGGESGTPVDAAAAAEQAAQSFSPSEPAADDVKAMADEAVLVEIVAELQTSPQATPLPNPAQPVDYVEWYNANTRTAGPGAAPLLEAAGQATVVWDGDATLRDAALAGDAAALQSPQVAAWLEANHTALEQFRAARGLEYHGSASESTDGSLIGILLPNLSRYRELARASTIEGKLLETQGRHEDAITLYADGLAAGAQLAHGQTLIENLVGSAVQSLSSEAVLDSLAAAPAGTDFSRVAGKLSDPSLTAPAAVAAMRGERAMVLETLQRVYTVDAGTGKYVPSPEGVARFLSMTSENANQEQRTAEITERLANSDFDTLVRQANEHYDMLEKAMATPYPQARAQFDELDRRTSLPDFKESNPILAELLPSLSRASFISARSDGARRAASVVSQLKAFRQQHGSYPESLDGLGGSDAVFDPFTQQQFRYQRVGDDFMLYSVGGNGVDDGGQHDPRGDTNDIRYWPRPPKEPK